MYEFFINNFIILVIVLPAL